MKFGIDWEAVSEKKRFENIGHIHVFSPRAGSDNPLGSIFLINSILQSIKSFAASFPPLNDFVTVFPI